VRIINTSDLTPDRALSQNERDWVYNGLDCCVTLEIRDVLRWQLDNVSSNTYQFSLALQAPILEMSTRGIRINLRRRAEVLSSMQVKIEQLSEQLTEIVRDGIGFPAVNSIEKGKPKYWWRSPTQLKQLLYDVMGLPVQYKLNKDKGIRMPSTDRNALEKLDAYFIAEPVIAHILALRDIDKKRAWLETDVDSDNRMRSNFNIAGTNTGRLASSASDFGTGTNLQNVTSSLRSVFIADPGMKFANLDLEQADSRNVGALCWNLFNDIDERFAATYLNACEAGDLHTFVCKMSSPELPWGTASDRQIAEAIAYRDKSYRQMAKVLGHGSNYLGQPQTMAKHSKLPVQLVANFHKNYFAAFPCIPAWHQSVFRNLETFSSLTTLFGRRRYFWGRPAEGSTRREAVAYAPQSMTGDEINTGILNLWRANKVQLLMQVHDSILFQYPEEQEAEIIPWALETLKAPLTLAKGREFVVPTEAMVGWNWGYYDKSNPDGLAKWKGSDNRKRTGAASGKLSLKLF